MAKKSSILKPSLQRIEEARADIKSQIAEERTFPSPRQDVLSRLRKERLQMKDLLNHLQISPRFIIKEDYVFNMVDGVLELLRQYLQEELNTMLRGGKNESNRQYIRVRNELNVVITEQKRRSFRKSELKEVVEAI